MPGSVACQLCGTTDVETIKTAPNRKTGKKPITFCMACFNGEFMDDGKAASITAAVDMLRRKIESRKAV